MCVSVPRWSTIPSFSVHADHDELVGWLGSATRPPETAYLVHGEPDASNALHDAIEDRLDWEAVVPRHLERVRLAWHRAEPDGVSPGLSGVVVG